VSAASSIPFVGVTIGPGADSLETIVHFSIGRDATKGPFRGEARLVVSRVPQDTVRIAVEGFVLSRWRPYPYPLHIALTKFSSDKAPHLFMRRTVDAPARVTRASIDVPGLSAHVLPIEEGRAYRIVVLSEGGWAAGRAEGRIRIETTDSREPVVSVPVTVLVGPARATR
jgi:hypothetical protein